MTKEQLAEKLNGREYLEEITDAESTQAREDGLLVVFGYSDDNVEFRGAFSDELGCYEGGDIFITRDGPLDDHEDCKCEYCGYNMAERRSVKIEAVWSVGDYSWQFKTALPHAAFDIKEGDEKFCQGIVINFNDLP